MLVRVSLMISWKSSSKHRSSVMARLSSAHLTEMKCPVFFIGLAITLKLEDVEGLRLLVFLTSSPSRRQSENLSVSGLGSEEKVVLGETYTEDAGDIGGDSNLARISLAATSR